MRPAACQPLPWRHAIDRPETALPPSACIGAESRCTVISAASDNDRNDWGITSRESSTVTLAPEPARSDAVVYAESLFVATTILSPDRMAKRLR